MATSKKRRVLSVDVGGTGLKASVLSLDGRMLKPRIREVTPVGAPPGKVVQILVRMARTLGEFDLISVGFPGVVRDGVVRTAPNLGHDGWRGYPLAHELQKRLGKPVRLANDADMQGLAVIRGKGLEMVVTLGTGFGTGLYLDGKLLPHMEISQIPYKKGENFDAEIGDRARKKIGNARWNRRMRKVLRLMRVLTNFDHLYIGGGNARRLKGGLEKDWTVVSNDAGITGGAALWRMKS